jgi:hypothetical protein
MTNSNDSFGRLSPALMIFLGLMAAGAGYAQTTADCSLRGADTTLVSGVTVKKCLDLDALNGQSVVIPSNVTRIDNSGFTLCESSEQSGGQADIIYVMDQSGSMGISYIWISPDLKDTVYLESSANCGYNNNDLNGFGTVTLPNDAGVRQVNRVNPAKPPTGCTSFAGDPYTQRGIAFKQAIDFQAARAPRSTAGYMGFAANVIDPIRPLILNVPANVTRLKAAMAPKLQNSTNYKAPLDTAKKWLLTPAISPNPTQAIIFLSDGQPTVPSNNPDAYLDVLSATYPAMPGVMPPVFGIFMGRPTSDTAKLADLSRRTGGQFWLIPSSRPDSLKAVVERILNVILRQYQPSSAVVTNNGVVPSQTGLAGANDFTRLSDGQWQMTLDKPVGLRPAGINPIDATTEMVDVQSGTVKPKSVTFTLSTTGPQESVNKNLIGTQFSVSCVDVPPPINPVKVAYIRDTDGDGRGDKVFFVFTRPLAALPPSIDAIYWNDFGPAFANAGPPVLSFLVGTGNTVVIADLTFDLHQFPKGRTGIPPNGHPIAILPAGGVLQAQRPSIADSIGPILDSATIRPFDNSKVVPGAELNMDTIVIYASEEIRTTADWNTVLVWSKSINGKCEDYKSALPVQPSGSPREDVSHRKLTLIVPTGTGVPTPLAGDCVYLNTNGLYTDKPLNIPPELGVVLKGPRPPREIELFRGFPPVVGMTAANPGFLVINNDPRKGDNMDYSTKTPDGKYEVQWIPPVGFANNVPFNPVIPDIKTSPTGIEPGGLPVPFPNGYASVQVVSTGKYVVDVSIYDNNGNFVRKFKQAFGFNGELNNKNRISNRGLVSYLIWDLKDYKNQKAGQGVFIWKALFRFDTNKEEVQYTKTGVMRTLRP